MASASCAATIVSITCTTRIKRTVWIPVVGSGSLAGAYGCGTTHIHTLEFSITNVWTSWSVLKGLIGMPLDIETDVPGPHEISRRPGLTIFHTLSAPRRVSI